MNVVVSFFYPERDTQQGLKGCLEKSIEKAPLRERNLCPRKRKKTREEESYVRVKNHIKKHAARKKFMSGHKIMKKNLQDAVGPANYVVPFFRVELEFQLWFREPPQPKISNPNQVAKKSQPKI